MKYPNLGWGTMEAVINKLGGIEGKKFFENSFTEIVSLENLLAAWQEFLRGKRTKLDVQQFDLELIDNLLQLHEDLLNFTYHHGPYQAFSINDPKPRHVHKASVRDRLLHHAIYRILYPFFDQTFISDSFSCRLGKGTHKALARFRGFAYQVSHNHTRTVWVLKCDIKQFFASIDQGILRSVLAQYISDQDILWLLNRVIDSFSVGGAGVGLPLGNLTSQLLVNIYMNPFDQFVKHKLKAKHYIRYADDFVFLANNRDWLISLIPKVQRFLNRELKLNLHPDKVFIKTLASGVDFLGWVHFPDHRILRTTTKKRMERKIGVSTNQQTIQSYLGLLNHGNARKLEHQILISTTSPS